MAGIFHLAPPLWTVTAGRLRAVKFSDAGILAGEISNIISRLPYIQLENASGFNGMLFSAAMAVICLMLFTAGYIYTRTLCGEFTEHSILGSDEKEN